MRRAGTRPGHSGIVRAGRGLATQRIGVTSQLSVVDAILSGIHQPGTSHYESLRERYLAKARGLVLNALESKRRLLYDEALAYVTAQAARQGPTDPEATRAVERHGEQEAQGRDRRVDARRLHAALPLVQLEAADIVRRRCRELVHSGRKAAPVVVHPRATARRSAFAGRCATGVIRSTDQ